MKVSLILEAIDRMTRPVRQATASIRSLTDRGLRPAGQAMERVSRIGGRFLAPMAGQLDRANAAARRLASGGLRVLRGAAYGAGYAVGFLVRKAAGLALRGAGLAIAGVGALGGWLTGGVIAQASKFEQFQVVLENTEGSAAAAKRAMAWVKDFAKTTPYEIGDVMEAFVALKAYGIDAANGSLRSLGNAASGMGKPLMQAVEMLADAQTGEYERLKEFGVRASQQGKKVTFTYMQAGREVTRTANKSSAEIQRAILGIFDARFKGMMDRQSRTLSGLWSNLQDMVSTFQLDVADAGFFDSVKTKVGGALDWINAKAKDGTLKRWATEVSERLTVMVQKGTEFVRSVDWNAVATAIGTIVSAVTKLVEWLGKAVRLWNALNAPGAAVDRAVGGWTVEGAAKKLFTWDPVEDWMRGKPTAPTSRAAPSGRPAAPGAPKGSPTGARRDLWMRSLPTPAPAAAPSKVSLDIRLSGPGAATASVAGIKSGGNTSVSVNRGAAMGAAV